ncbi:MAG: DUF814 domain-containing protein [Candidatus Eremiobacteraeota bacterium]|nr:DUF814 domain-containing protein [Candidatus Eremiobacteraeota bacterium]
MRTDWQLIRRAAEEIQSRFAGARVRDVGLLPDGRVAIQLNRRGEDALLAFDPFGTPPLVTVEHEALPIAAEPGFVRALGAALRGTTLHGAQSRTSDRLMRLQFGTRSRFGVGDEVTLYAELVPRFGNLILVKRDVVVAALKEFSLAENGTRSVQAGMLYEAPPLVSRESKGTDVPEDRSVLDAFKDFRDEKIGSGERARTVQRRAQLRKRLDARERKLLEERRKLEEKRAKAMARESLREEGESLFATLHEMDDKARDDAKERAAKLFAQYKKLGASLPHIDARAESIDAALRAVEQLRWEAERADDADLTDVERAVGQLEGRPDETMRSQSKSRKRAPLEVRTAGGSRILIGRSPSENAELTFHVARPNDLWFHAQNIPGAHVILQRDDRTAPPPDDLRRAAALAAFYSKAKASTKVPIDYTERKHVRAQRDAPPGLVWYTNPRTLVVEPEAS